MLKLLDRTLGKKDKLPVVRNVTLEIKISMNGQIKPTIDAVKEKKNKNSKLGNVSEEITQKEKMNTTK